MTTDRDVLHQAVKAYDVRGLVEDLQPRLIRALGVGAAQELAGGTGRIVLGRDMRASSPVWADALVDGITSRGVDVVDIGLASTDQLSYAAGVLDAPGAMITASHNPASYNGIKFCRAGAAPVAIDSGLAAIRDGALAALEAEPDAGDQPRGTRTEHDLLDDFAAHVRSFIDTSRLREVHVAVDAGNGMGGHVWPKVVEGLPIVTHPLYFELDGTFPNHPANPLDAANLVDLGAEVVGGGHALGLAFDGDADRVFAVDEHGQPVASSLVGAVVAERLLRTYPGATILHNLICSRVVAETIEAGGGTAVRTRVGHSFIKQRMAQTDAVFAIEHSGHFYFRDNYRADSGLIAALVLLEAVADAGKPLSEVLAPYDRYPSSGELNLTVDDAPATIDRVEAAFADRATEHDREDGLTVALTGGWFNLRPSNTEPVVRLNVEGDDQLALDAMVAEVLETVGGDGPH